MKEIYTNWSRLVYFKRISIFYVERYVETEVTKIVDNLTTLLVDGVITHLSKGTTLFYKGDVTTHAYFVVEGSLVVQNPHPSGETYLISHIEQGSFMCDLEIISEKLVNTTTLVANTDCTLLKFSSEQFLYALKKDHDFLFMVSNKLAEKMYRESYRLGDDLYKSAVDKLRGYLMRSYREYSQNDQLTIQKTRQIISHEIGLSIKTVNRSVKRLKEQKRLTILAGKIHMTATHYKLLFNDLAE